MFRFGCRDCLKSNAPAHRERPERVLSALAEPQRGRDAVARIVRRQPLALYRSTRSDATGRRSFRLKRSS
jgi:hypothetical protein